MAMNATKYFLEQYDLGLHHLYKNYMFCDLITTVLISKRWLVLELDHSVSTMKWDQWYLLLWVNQDMFLTKKKLISQGHAEFEYEATVMLTN